MKTKSLFISLFVVMWVVVAGASTALARPTKLGTFSGTTQTRGAIFKWQIFGKKTKSEKTVSLLRDGKQLTRQTTHRNLLGKGKDLVTTEVGHIESENTVDGTRILQVRFDSPGFLAEAQRAVDTAVASKGLQRGVLEINAISEKTTYAISASQRYLQVKSISTSRVTKRFGGFLGAVMNFVTRNNLKSTQKGELLNTNVP